MRRFYAKTRQRGECELFAGSVRPVGVILLQP